MVGNQPELLDKILATPPSVPVEPQVEPAPAPHTPVVDEALVERVRALWSYARSKGDNWLMSFTDSIGKSLKAGRPLTPRQEKALRKNLSVARVAQMALPSQQLLRRAVHRLLAHR